MNYYQRHIGDYARDAGHLTMLEHGAYTLLLDNYYVSEKGIPDNEDLCKLMRAKTEEEKAALNYVLSKFFVLKKGCWVNNRVEEELRKANKKIKSAKLNGQIGGRPKSKKINENDDVFKKNVAAKNQDGLGDIYHGASDKIEQKPTGLFLETDSVNLAYGNVTQSKAPHTPTTNHQPPITNIKTTPIDITHFSDDLTKISVALKSRGINLINLHNPKLIELLQKGATINDFIEASKIAEEKSKGLPYLLGIVDRRSKKSFQKFGRHHSINIKNMDEGVNEDGSF
jgi:uncharacterized protein YdaU (DUF1376 family)